MPDVKLDLSELENPLTIPGHGTFRPGESPTIRGLEDYRIWELERLRHSKGVGIPLKILSKKAKKGGEE